MHTGNPLIDNTNAELIVGSDEAGRGNWAGPIVTVAVCVPRGWTGPPGLADSKTIKKEKHRFALRAVLLRDPTLSYIVVQSLPEAIDRIGVHKTNILDHQRAHKALVLQRSGTLLRIADGTLPLGPDIVSLPKADALVPAVSAASILAKTTLDLFMREAEKTHPGYDFGENKGYGTPKHMAGLQKLGPCPLHRRSFQPVKDALKAGQGNPIDLMGELPE